MRIDKIREGRATTARNGKHEAKVESSMVIDSLPVPKCFGLQPMHVELGLWAA